MSALLEVRALRRTFPVRGSSGRLAALDAIDLRVEAGECVAIVGESGSGKSTFGRCLTRLLEPDSGEILFAGEDLLALRGVALRQARRQMQMVFQNSAAAFDPRLRIGAALREALRGATNVPTVDELLGSVGLDGAYADRFPSQLSGGQRQRVNIARALATRPRLLILDEPVSALDVSVQARILHLLADLRASHDLTMLLITHDLAIAAQLAERIVVFHEGRIVEEGATREVLSHPRHPRTAAFLAAIPSIVPRIREKIG